MGLALGVVLKFYTSVAKELKLKARKSWGLIPTFVEVAAEKLVGGHFYQPHPFLTLHQDCSRQNSDNVISDGWVSVQSFINKNCHNSRTSHNIEIKLEPVIKLDKKTQKRQRIWWWRYLNKLWSHCLFSDLWSIQSHTEVRF